MKYNLNTHASASAIAKILGIEFTKIKEFKEFLEASALKTVDKTYVVKNKTVEYQAYNIIEAVEMSLETIEGNHIQSIAIDIK